MCGRFAIGVDAATLVEIFTLVHATAYEPHADVAPTMTAPVILDSVKRGGWTAEPFRWGLVPHFARDLDFGRRTFNARVETAGSTPAFRHAASKRRCLVPVTSFYEWSTPEGGGRKIKHRVTAGDEAAFGLAGLWERWRDADGRPMHTFSVLTQPSSGALAPIHHRSPILVAPERRARWLDPTWTDGPAAMAWIVGGEAPAWQVSDA